MSNARDPLSNRFKLAATPDISVKPDITKDERSIDYLKNAEG